MRAVPSFCRAAVFRSRNGSDVTFSGSGDRMNLKNLPGTIFGLLLEFIEPNFNHT